MLINGRFVRQQVTGVQRVAHEISSRLVSDYGGRVILPPNIGKLGHLYDQFNYPLIYSDDILLSLTNTGPVFHPKHVVMLHDVAVIEHPEWFSKKFHFYYKNIIPVLLKNARLILTVSEFSKLRIIENYPFVEGKIEVVPNGVSNQFFAKTTLSNELKNRYQISENKYILTVGSIEPRKNLMGLLKAWNFSSCSDKGLKLVVVGGRSENFKQQDIKGDVPSVVFTGYVTDDELISLYSNALGFAYASFYEGFGLPVVEAMAAGLPVLVSRNTACHEISGDRAILVDPYNISDISKGLEVLCSQGVSFVRSTEIARSYNWDRSVEVLVKHLKGVNW
jgi:glycosyltransferase involved in cell wall biosynthesis